MPSSIVRQFAFPACSKFCNPFVPLSSVPHAACVCPFAAPMAPTAANPTAAAMDIRFFIVISPLPIQRPPLDDAVSLLLSRLRLRARPHTSRPLQPTEPSARIRLRAAAKLTLLFASELFSDQPKAFSSVT